ncbi:MAG: tetratricopeptide repeat protein [Bradymonadaceae bacterium]|nr:tetratricopeptide repeat protein [Lujinxingiaceae bacterium]
MSEIFEGTIVAGRFVVAERIGEGGMGAVYRALQTSLDREVALKVLHSQQAFTARARRRFGREARAVARLNHPHIASVFDFGTDNDDQTLWLAMELVAGRSLGGLKREPLDILRIISLADQILSALAAAHARGIIHRDLKPSNILLTRDDEGREVIKLVDFGLAATQDGELDLDNAPGGLGDEQSEVTSARVIMGTPRYMAPELFRRHPIDPRVDLYALGIILYEIVAGKAPYPGDDPREIMRGHLKEPIPQLRAREGDVPPELERCIYKLLAKEASERYQTAAEVREGLQAIISEFSYVPWMVGGPRIDGEWGSMSRLGNLSAPGFLSGRGGQTVPPSLAMGSVSKMGGGSAPAPLVGREVERRTIEKHIRATIAIGHGSIVFIEGEAGVGKSRLLDWIRVRVEEAGVMKVAQGTYSRNVSGFQGIRAILEEVLGARDSTYEDMPYLVESRLRKWNFSPDEIELCIKLMQPGGDAAIFESTGPASERRLSGQERAFAVVERVLRQVSQAKPWLLILEDVHCAGETTLSFLQHLAVGMHLDPMAMMLVATVRTEELGEVPEMRYALERLARFGSENFARLRLDRLSVDEATNLVLKLAPLDKALATRIAVRSAGNPLHVAQILRYLQESTKLVYNNGQWQLTEGVDIATEIPDELGELMRFRIRQVASRHSDAPAMMAILERAAILGQRFDYRLLRHFVGVESGSPWRATLDTSLESLVKEGFLREVGQSGEDILEFDHIVMRDVLLQSLEGRRSLMGLHRVAAETKTAFYGKRSSEIAMQIVEHYRRARDPSGVYAFTVKAARAALDVSDFKTAMELYRSAKNLVDSGNITAELTVLDDVSGVLKGEEVALELAHLERRLGEYASARQHYRRLLSDGNSHIALWAKWGLGDVASRQGELEEALGWYEVAQREAEASQTPASSEHDTQVYSLVAAFSLAGLGGVEHARGDFAIAERRLSEALARAQKLQHRTLEAEVLRLLTDVVWRLGDANKAEVFYRRASILEESFGDQEAVASGMLHSAEFLREAGQTSRAETQAQQARAIFEELGKRHNEAHCLLTLGHIAWCRGDFKTAANHYRQAHRHYEAFQDRRGITHCNLHLARLAMSVQRLKETQTLVQEALEGFRAMGDRRGVAQVRIIHGRLEHAVGRHEQARETFESAAKSLETLGDRRSAVCARAFETLVLEELGQYDVVDARLDEMLATVPAFALADEGLATAFDKLCGLINHRRPDLAMQLDEIAEETWQRLGRPSRVASV